MKVQVDVKCTSIAFFGLNEFNFAVGLNFKKNNIFSNRENKLGDSRCRSQAIYHQRCSSLNIVSGLKYDVIHVFLVFLRASVEVQLEDGDLRLSSRSGFL